MNKIKKPFTSKLIIKDILKLLIFILWSFLFLLFLDHITFLYIILALNFNDWILIFTVKVRDIAIALIFERIFLIFFENLFVVVFFNLFYVIQLVHWLLLFEFDLKVLFEETILHIEIHLGFTKLRVQNEIIGLLVESSDCPQSIQVQELADRDNVRARQQGLLGETTRALQFLQIDFKILCEFDIGHSVLTCIDLDKIDINPSCLFEYLWENFLGQVSSAPLQTLHPVKLFIRDKLLLELWQGVLCVYLLQQFSCLLHEVRIRKRVWKSLLSYFQQHLGMIWPTVAVNKFQWHIRSTDLVSVSHHLF